MIPKISVTAAFLLMVAPPMACASNRAATPTAPVTRQAYESQSSMVVAQDSQGAASENENDNDNDNDNSSDSNDSADENQNDDNNQTDQENAATNPPQFPNGAATDPDNAPQFNQAPQPQPVNPYQ